MASYVDPEIVRRGEKRAREVAVDFLLFLQRRDPRGELPSFSEVSIEAMVKQAIEIEAHKQ